MLDSNISLSLSKPTHFKMFQTLKETIKRDVVEVETYTLVYLTLDAKLIVAPK